MAHAGSDPSVTLVTRLGELDVYRVEHPPARWGMVANAYILRHGAAWAVIDCGWPGPAGAQVWDDCVTGLGLGWSALRSVWITHAHPDHLGQARHLFERSGCVPAMHPEALSEFQFARGLVSAGGESAFAAQFRRMGLAFAEGATFPNPFGSHSRIAVPPDFRPLVAGEPLCFAGETFQAILTPGHCHGHICIWHAGTRTLFAGDTVISNGFPPIVVMPGTSDNPMGDYLATLGRLRALEAKLCLSGHGAPLPTPNARLDETVAYHSAQMDRIAGILSAGPLTATAIAAALRHRNIPLTALSNLGKVQVHSEILAYLHYLVAEGKIVADQSDASGALQYCRC
ncbi:MBL fold metallo-hydrolase [Devosia sp. FKR38]|uniref:MBL fold metallo-hydrolase n=1 Tax=Devosia sp. FKR38 TaxID=2562312 RepID=UPI0010C0B21B|nr:MBL fold metallo-hydrolase [Devosia sp. FKR38]